MKKIKILHVTGAMNRGGAEVMLMDIYRNISEKFHFDFLINYKHKLGVVKGDFDEEIQANGAQIKYIPTQWDIGPKKYAFEFKKKCKEIGVPDIVHIHMNAKSGVIAWAAKKAGIKTVIVHSHADLKFRGNLVSRVLSQLELQFQKRLIAKYADYYWGCSNEANASLFYERLLTKNKAAVINNAIDTKAFQMVSDEAVEKLRKSYNITENTLVLGNVGRIVSHKNVLFIIEVLNELQKKGLDVVFVFAGRAEQPDYLQRIFQKAEEYKITERIRYLDVRDDVPVVMHSFDVFMGPALKEGFGLVAVEAQAAGLPCYLYKGFPKTVDMNLDLVTFFDSFSVSEWTDAIFYDVSQNKKIAKEEIGEKIMSKGFDIETNTRKIEELYSKIV